MTADPLFLLNSGLLKHVLHCPKSLCDEGGYQIVNIVNKDDEDKCDSRCDFPL